MNFTIRNVLWLVWVVANPSASQVQRGNRTEATTRSDSAGLFPRLNSKPAKRKAK